MFSIFEKGLHLQKLPKFLKFWALRGWGLGGKCDTLLVNLILIFISKNLLKGRIAVVISYELALLLCRSRTAIFFTEKLSAFCRFKRHNGEYDKC